jgi:hypothetical protein
VHTLAVRDAQAAQQAHAGALAALQDIHSEGPQHVAPVARGEAAFQGKSVAMIKMAQAHGQPLHRSGALPDPDTWLNKRIATRLGRAIAAETAVRKSLSSDQWCRMSWQQRRDFFLPRTRRADRDDE